MNASHQEKRVYSVFNRRGAFGVFNRHLFTLMVLGFVLCGASARNVTLPVNVFAGRQSVILRDVPNLSQGEKLSFRVAKDHRTLASGTVAVGEDGEVSLPVALSGMKPGVAMQLELSLTKVADGVSIPLRSGTVWAFSEQPFTDAADPAGGQRIFLYDPEGKTEAAFESVQLKAKCVDRFGDLESVTNACIVIHEGFSMESVRGFDDILNGWVRRGNRVLLIAPAEGTLVLPDGLESCWYGMASKGLRRPSGISDLGYALDLSSMTGCRFRLVGIREAAALQVDPVRGYEAAVWRRSANEGAVVFCGLNLISNWEKTPAARWLLAEILLLSENVSKE